jgi:hypothetical protein
LFLELDGRSIVVSAMKSVLKSLSRGKFALLSFVLTLATGIGLSLGPSFKYWMWPAFNHAEASAKLGRRVRHVPTKEFGTFKCPPEGYCMRLQPGELGTIVALEPVKDGYFLVVRWDQPSVAEDYVSFIGRYSSQAIAEQ